MSQVEGLQGESTDGERVILDKEEYQSLLTQAKSGRMLEDIIHSLKNRASGPLGYMDVAKQEFDETSKGYEYFIEARKQLEVLRDSLCKTFHHLANGRNTKRENLDIGHFIKSEIDVYSGTKDFRGVVIDSSGILDNVCIDMSRSDLSEIISNLLINSAEAMPEGSYEKNIWVSATKDCSSAYIKVIDNGEGIKENIIDKVFDRYFTTKSADAKVSRGSKDILSNGGIGLAHVKEIITQYGGSIDVDSKPGTGTEFKISFPVVNQGWRCLADMNIDEKEKYVMDSISESDSVPGFSRALTKIVHLMVDGPSPDIPEYVKSDTALSMKVIELANSVHYGYLGGTDSIDVALERIKHGELRKLCCDLMSHSIFGSLQGKLGDIWRESYMVANIAYRLAKMSGESAEQAYTTGLLCNVGKFILADRFPDDYRIVYDDCEEQNGRHIFDSRLEKMTFGITHQELSGRFIDKYLNVSDEMVYAVRRHHGSSSGTSLKQIAVCANWVFNDGSIGKYHDSYRVASRDIEGIDAKRMYLDANEKFHLLNSSFEN